MYTYVIEASSVGIGIILQEISGHSSVLDRLALGFRPASGGAGSQDGDGRHSGELHGGDEVARNDVNMRDGRKTKDEDRWLF